MGPFEIVKTLAATRAATLFLVVLLFAGACSDDPGAGSADEPEAPAGKTEPQAGTTTLPEGELETTGEAPPPEVTLGPDRGGRPEIVIRLEGDPKTTFTGLCSVGGEQNVLSGQVPKRFTFDPVGGRLECRIEKRDEGEGDLKVVLVAGNATRSVQQTSSPGGVINLSYESG